ncbi:hypothetical protein D3C78_1056710 [compost metagenome]
MVAIFSPFQRCADLRITCGGGIDGGDGTLGGYAGHPGRGSDQLADWLYSGK